MTGRLVAAPEPRSACASRLLDGGALDRLPLAVEPVELARDAARLHGVPCQQQPRAERGVADPSAGIDARADEDSRDASIPAGRFSPATSNRAARPGPSA